MAATIASNSDENSVFLSQSASQNSPHHILNILNDKCIQRILRYLIWDINDFLNAAEVCTKFQENAKQCFPRIFLEKLRINYPYSEILIDEDNLPRFLKMFGPLIHTIEWEHNKKKTHENKSDAEIFSAISQYCGKTLCELCACGHKLDFQGLKFDALQNLRTGGCSLYNFKTLPKLEKMLFKMKTIENFSWISNTFPNLTEFDLMYFPEQFNNEMLLEFLASNPQLQRLHILPGTSIFDPVDRITYSILKNLPTRTPNLTALYLRLNDKDLEENITHLTRMGRKLKSLKIFNRISEGTFIDSLAESGLLIEEFMTDGINTRVAESLSKLMHLRKLKLWEIREETIIEIVEKVWHLEYIEVCLIENISIEGIKKILMHGKNLKQIRVEGDFSPPIIKLDDYNTILELAKTNQITVNLDFRNRVTANFENPIFRWIDRKWVVLNGWLVFKVRKSEA